MTDTTEAPAEEGGPVRFMQQHIALDYVLRNPIAASLVQDGEEWPHSWIRDIES